MAHCFCASLATTTACGSSVSPTVNKDDVALTNATSRTIESGFAACSIVGEDEEPIAHRESWYSQAFNLPKLNAPDNLQIDEFEFAVNRAVGKDGSQPVTVRLYEIVGSGDMSELEELGSADADVDDLEKDYVSIPFDPPVLLPDGAVVLAEVYAPEGEDDGNLLLLGLNNRGHSNGSFLRFPDCGFLQTVNIDEAFPDIAGSGWVFSIRGAVVPAE